VAALTDRRAAPGVAGAFFEGAGYAFANIISIIVSAACFGEGVKGIGLDRAVGRLIQAQPDLLVPAAGLFPLGFAFISGSGSAAAQSVIGFFARPAVEMGLALEHVGAVVSLGAAAGRTMSLVAAVTLMCASLTGTRPIALIRRVAGPILAGMLAVVIAGTAARAAGWWEVPSAPAAGAPAAIETPASGPAALRGGG
jgi:DcuC family C4-dicarboxylate transporter